jgi:hypothetical protein
MKPFIPLMTLFAMLGQAMFPIVVAVHNEGKNPQQYDLPLAIATALFGWFVLMFLMLKTVNRP